MNAVPSRNLMGIIMAALAVLLLPVLLLVLMLLALAMLLFFAVPLCHKMTNGATGGISACANCYTDFCPLTLALITLSVLPLGLIAFLFFRKRSRLP